MYCKTCQIVEVKGKRIYCSNECKFADPELNARRANKVKNDPNKQIKCKIDGKIFSDINNLSGNLSTYSKNVLLKEFDWNDWEVIDKLIDYSDYWTCPHCNWKGKAKNGQDSGGWISKHLERDHNISKIEHVNQYPNDRKLWPNKLKMAERTELLHQSEDNRVECLECHQWFKKISNSHLRERHNISMDSYKKKHPFARVNSKELSDRTREIYFAENGLSKVNPVSNGELEVKEFVESLGFLPTKFRNGFSEIDIYIPDLKIGFEYHGIFHHSQFRGNHKKHRHFDNLNYAEQLGIHLIQIFEDEWLHKKDIVKSRIKNILKIDSTILYARKCEVRFLTNKESKQFLDENHLQGYKYAKYSIGLIFNGLIVQCMTFSDINSRVNGIKQYASGIFENVRSCSKMNYNVVGGFERMLKYFETNVKPVQIISFADRRWSSLLKEPFYIRLGFDFVSKTGPCFWAMKGYNRRMHRSNFTKKKMRAMNPALFVGFKDDDLTQEKMLMMLEYDIIWDCGNLKFAKNYKSDVPIAISIEIEEDTESDDIVFNNRKRHPIDSIPDNSTDYVLCQLCNHYFKSKGFSTHIRYEHKLTNLQYIDQFGEYRPSKLKK